MDTLIQTFHLDIKLIIAQLVNFLIVAIVLWQFALKPLMKIMNERTKKIEKGLDDAKKIEEKLLKVEKERNQIISQAQKDALEIMAKANSSADEKRHKMLAVAKEEVEKVVLEGKKQINQEKEKMIKETKSELIDLVILVTEKILGKKVDAKINKDLIKDSFSEITKK